MFIGRTDAKAETPILWPLHAKSWIIGKDSDAGRDWGQEEKGTTEDEMAGWHHRLDGYGFGWTPGVGDGQGGLACCNSWGRKELDTTERLNWTELIHKNYYIFWVVSIVLWRRQWHPTPVLLPGKCHGGRSLVGCSPWVARSWTRLSDFTFTFHFHALEKEMTTHSSVLAWRIPGTGEPGGLLALGSHRVRHDWSNLAAAAA